MNEIDLITGYKSPSTPFSIFKRQLTDILEIGRSVNRIIMGDFNFNTMFDRNSLSTFMGQMNFSNNMPNQESTTNYNTQIDVVFSNFDQLTSGSYESYFSDHKPIFCMIHSGKI